MIDFGLQLILIYLRGGVDVEILSNGAVAENLLRRKSIMNGVVAFN